MSEEIFRKKSLDRVKSPEDLNDYVRVANPGVWLIIAAIIILLIGTVIWGILGRVETKVDVDLISKDGLVVISNNDVEFKDGMTVEFNGKKYNVEVFDGSSLGSMFVSGLALTDGTYSAQLVVESINPISFIIN